MDMPVAQMVLLRYPPSSSTRAGCGAHTDCGLTLLAQDRDGLQIKDSKGCWIDAPMLSGPDAGECLLVNLGDMAEQWSNMLYKSTWHRVDNRSGDLRHSIPFFCNCNFDAVVDPKSSVCAGSIADLVGPPKFEPTQAGHYLCEKLGLMWQQ